MNDPHILYMARESTALYSALMGKTPEVHAAFGKRLRKARKALGWKTTRAFAEALGEAESVVSMWERGHRFPRLDRLLAIKKLTRASIDWLIEGDTSGLSVELLKRFRQEPDPHYTTRQTDKRDSR